MFDHSLLLSPLNIGAHRVPNRIVSTAHAENMANSGKIPRNLIEYHVRRAEGGTGMIVAFGSATVHPDADNKGNVSLWDPENEPALREMAARIRKHGTVLLAQASHRGPREKPTSPNAFISSPSPMSTLSPYGTPHILTVNEIDEIVEAYAQVAERLSRCNFSGIEITSLGSHLMELFWSPYINRRTDRYGGTFQNRLRLTYEIIDAIDQAVPSDFLLSFRLSLDTQDPSLGLANEELLKIVEFINSTGKVDVFSISGGSGANIETQAGNVPTEAYPTATYSHLAKKVKQIVDVPVTVAGRILDADSAEECLTAKQTDLVGMTRALIADPALPQHIKLGTAANARPCIAINEGCRRVTLGGSLACTVNPAIFDPTLEHPVPAIRPRRIAIIGAGPAGLEAARVAASRGHNVEVYEKDSTPGGQVKIAAQDGSRPHLLRHINWLINELNSLDVSINFDTTVKSDFFDYVHVDDIILATGSTTIVPPEIDHYAMPTITDVDLLLRLDIDLDNRNVTIFDAQSYRRGAAIAATIAERFTARVRLATPALEQMAQLEIPNKPPLLRRLAAAKVESLTSYTLKFGSNGYPRLSHMWSSEEFDFNQDDLLVTVGWAQANDQLVETLHDKKTSTTIHVIGDAWAPRLIRNAISEGVKIGTVI